MASRIEDYGLIGNLHTAALVSKSGSIDWLCAPRFDSDSCFGALLGYDEHGRWLIRPTVSARQFKQSYRKDTLILESEMICDNGAVRLTEFMPLKEDRCEIIRIVEGLEGSVPMEMLLDVRFGYGTNQPWITEVPSGLSFVAGPDAAVLRSTVPISFKRRTASAFFEIKKGETVSFQFGWFASHLKIPYLLDVHRELKHTESAWTRWSNQCVYQGRWRDAVLRSLITLKALTFRPTGAIVAAPTTSLPEELGGVRNWDYRYCWIRDASLTLNALMVGGYMDEATAFRDWLLRVMAGDPSQTQIMYSIDGRRRLTEMDLLNLPGYEGSKPVRIGNAASEQFQLDIFGEMLSAIYMGRQMGLAPRREAVPVTLEFLRHIDRVWQYPDEGIWEVRGGRRHFTHSKVMAWVAVDRAIRLIEEFGDQPIELMQLLPHLRALRERIHEETCQRGYHPGIKSFTQSYGCDFIDASTLLIPRVGFLPAEDPRVQNTIAAVERELLRDGLVRRYDPRHHVDGLPGSDGAFLACSFWLADSYAFLGRMQEAEQLFEHLLSLRNHLGLLSEEYDPVLRRQIGNFPQGFSHLALVASAETLNKASQKKVAA